jgi:hypothetical protein
MNARISDEPVASLPRAARRPADRQARLGLVLWLALGALVLILSAA